MSRQVVTVLTSLCRRDACRIRWEEDTYMADLPPYGTPRWVKVFVIIALVLVLLVAVIMATGAGGGHGPGRHMPSGGAGGHTPTSSVTAHSVQ